MKDKLATILEQFNISGDICDAHRIPGGLINETYYARTDRGEYVIQKINSEVFSDPEGIMSNIALITSHLRSKESEPEQILLPEYYSSYGKNYTIIDSEYWRVCDYIGNSMTLGRSDVSADVLKSAGCAFGCFNRLLSDMDPNLLIETIPHFHDTPGRLKTLEEAFIKDPAGRAEVCSDVYKAIMSYADLAGTLQRMTDGGQLPLRVTHNDTKLDNVLFDKDKPEPVAVIDLDTCMPGYLCFDFGDSVRSGCATSDEDCPEGMDFDMDLFRAYTEGYMSQMAGILTQTELESLIYGPPVITLELAARFLYDFLMGDKYFAVNSPEQNLRRSEAQLRLFRGMLERLDDMKAIVRASLKHI